MATINSQYLVKHNLECNMISTIFKMEVFTKFNVVEDEVINEMKEIENQISELR